MACLQESNVVITYQSPESNFILGVLPAGVTSPPCVPGTGSFLDLDGLEWTAPTVLAGESLPESDLLAAELAAAPNGTRKLLQGTGQRRLYSTQWGVRAVNADQAWAAGYDGTGEVVCLGQAHTENAGRTCVRQRERERDLLARGCQNQVLAAPYMRAGVPVAVIDTSIDCNHPDLASNVLKEKRKSFVRGQDACTPSRTSFSHGSHVAGIAAGSGAVGTVGVAFNAKIIPIQVFPNGERGASTAAVLSAILYAAGEAGARIINLSLGGLITREDRKDLGPGFGRFWALHARVVNEANRLGALVVVAAGNDAKNTSALGSGRMILASLPNVLSVSATGPRVRCNLDFVCDLGAYYDANPGRMTDLDKGLASELRSEPPTGFDDPPSYTNYGKDVDLAAPGGSFDVTLPYGRTQSAPYGPPSPGNPALAPFLADNFYTRVLAPCAPYSPTRPDQAGPVCLPLREGRYAFASGTSMAAPHVAGVAALVLQKNPGLNPAQLKQVLLKSAIAPSNRALLPYVGRGVVDAFAAVMSA